MAIDSSTVLSVQQFVAHEAALLNSADWRRWLELFTPDGIYWMPLTADQTDARLHVSLLYDDAVVRDIRCRRWQDRHPDTGALSLQPAVRSLRYITNVFVRDAPAGLELAGALEARASVMYVEYARSVVRQWFGSVTWHLVPTGEKYLIALKRVDLINADGQISDLLAYI